MVQTLLIEKDSLEIVANLTNKNGFPRSLLGGK